MSENGESGTFALSLFLPIPTLPSPNTVTNAASREYQLLAIRAKQGRARVLRSGLCIFWALATMARPVSVIHPGEVNNSDKSYVADMSAFSHQPLQMLACDVALRLVRGHIHGGLHHQGDWGVPSR